MGWSLESNPLNHHELEIYKYIKRNTGNNEFAKTVSRFIDLRNYLDSHPFKSAEELRSNVLSNGVPIFSRPESEQLFGLLAKKGGADIEIIDNVVRQWANFIYEWQPSFLKGVIDIVSPYVFIASALEQLPVVGPLYTISLNSITATLPIIAASVENVTPTIIGSLPIPEAGPVGSIIGWMIASQFVVLSMLINISRDHFGQAFLLSFLMVPFLGTSLYNAALSGEKFIKKTAVERGRLLESAGALFGEPTAAVVDALVPDLLETEDQPKKTLPELGLPSVHTMADKVADVIAGPDGGKRLSSHVHSKGKWRTRRRSRL
jgi:hypothetical protein